MRRKLISESTTGQNRKIGCYLAFIAGAVNSGGFLAIGRYTSHMTGITSEFADNLFLQHSDIFYAALTSMLAFVLGGVLSAFLVNLGKFLHIKSKYAFVLLLEGLLILAFGFAASYFAAEKLLILAILCFIMGLQNATMTKISKAQIRTTHLTGLFTDASIELGKMLAKALLPKREHYSITVNYANLGLFCLTILMFILGGVCGAYGFGVYGYLYVAPLSLLLMAISIPALLYEWRICRRLKRFQRYKAKN